MYANARKRWTRHDDIFLVAYGGAVGYAFIAEHDLGRTRRAGRIRIAWLRKYRPEFVREVEAEVSEDQEREDVTCP